MSLHTKIFNWRPPIMRDAEINVSTFTHTYTYVHSSSSSDSFMLHASANATSLLMSLARLGNVVGGFSSR